MRHRTSRLRAFERVIVHAARQQLCCRPGCTTCGASEFLADGLLLLSRGLAPGHSLWRKYSQSARTQWSKQHRVFAMLDQQLLVARAERARLARIAEAANGKDWLPHLALFVMVVGDHERMSGRLGRAWRPQLHELFEPAPQESFECETGPLTGREILSYIDRAPRTSAFETP